MSSKKSRLRLYGDENIPIPCVAYLREKGISIRHAFEENYISRPDKEHLQESKVMDRVFLSLDNDMKKFSSLDLENHPGVIFISTSNLSPNHINKILDKMIKYISPAFVKHALVRLTLTTVVKEKAGIVIRKEIL